MVETLRLINPLQQTMFPNDRRQTLGEEIANTISHGLGAAGALAAAPILIVAAVRQGDAAFIAGAAIFAASMCLLYLASAIYHALPDNRAKRLFNVLDHSAIYLLIAGTYTPFALGALRGPWGWTLFGLVWGMALLGVGLKASKRLDRPDVYKRQVDVRQRKSSGRWRNGWTARPMASVTLSREFGFTRRMRALGTIE